MGQEENIVELKISQADLGHLRELLSSLVLTPIDEGESDGPAAASLKARELLDIRRKRATFFAPAMFGEAPWDILLTLFAANEALFGLSVTRLADDAGLSANSCRRWLDYLEQEQLIARRGPPNDQFVTLTSHGRQRMTDYLTALRDGPDPASN